MPDRDSFTIRENKLQKVNIKTGSKYVSNLISGIDSVSDINKMNDNKPIKKDVPKINKPKITQEMNNKNENEKSKENQGNTKEGAKIGENSGGQKMISYFVCKGDNKPSGKKDNNEGKEDDGKPPKNGEEQISDNEGEDQESTKLDPK